MNVSSRRAYYRLLELVPSYEKYRVPQQQQKSSATNGDNIKRWRVNNEDIVIVEMMSEHVSKEEQMRGIHDPFLTE